MIKRTLILGALAASSAAVAGPLGLGGPTGFESFSTDNAGGGWVIHHHVRGDTLWGCADIKSVDTCTQVYFDEWRPTAKMEMLHVTSGSHDAWFKMANKGFGDSLFACKTPEGGAPMCQRIQLDTAPQILVKLERKWPKYECDDDCGGEAAMSMPEARGVIESAAYSDIWLQLAVTGPGSSNLYACRDLAGTPTCQTAIPNWLVWNRQDIGISFSDIKIKQEDGSTTYGPGVLVKKVDEESVAYAAGIREEDVILSVGGFTTDRAAKAKAMVMQYPAGQPFELVKEGGETVVITAIEKPPKK